MAARSGPLSRGGDRASAMGDAREGFTFRMERIRELQGQGQGQGLRRAQDRGLGL